MAALALLKPNFEVLTMADMPAMLTADPWVVATEAQRHTAEGAEIGGDVFAHRAVAAGRSQHQRAMFIAQRQRQPTAGEGKQQH